MNGIQIMFALFRLATFISNNINHSTDTLQYERFFNQRKLPNDPSQSNSGNKNKQHKSASSSLLARISWLLEYNHNGLPYLIVTIMRLYANLFGLVTQSLYSILPFNRDPFTNEYLNPILRTMEYIHIYNYFEKYHMFNKIFALHLIQSMLMYCGWIRRKINNAMTNRYAYKKISIIEVDMAYADEIFSDIRGWVRLVLTLGRHECHMKSSLRTRRGKAMKELSQQLRKSHRIDRLYYFNQIEFNDCYKDMNIFVKTHLHQRNEPTTGSMQDNSKNSKQVFWRSFNLPERRSFVPEPGHRMDPVEFSLMVIFLTGGTVMDLLLVTASIASYLSLGEWSANSIQEIPRLLAVLIESFMFFLPLALNAYDCGLVCFSSLLCHSRARKLTNMLRTELKVYSSLVEAFWLDMDSYHQQSYRRGKSNLNWLTEHSEQSMKLQESGPQLMLKDMNAHIHSLTSTRINYLGLSPHKRDERSMLEISIEDFREHIGQEKLKEMNDNLSYLLDLVDVLQNEHHDARKSLTNYLNLNLLFSIPCLAVSFTITTSASSRAEFCLAIASILASWIPMFICMFLGATSERSVSLNPLV